MDGVQVFPLYWKRKEVPTLLLGRFEWSADFQSIKFHFVYIGAPIKSSNVGSRLEIVVVKGPIVQVMIDFFFTIDGKCHASIVVLSENANFNIKPLIVRPEIQNFVCIHILGVNRDTNVGTERSIVTIVNSQQRTINFAKLGLVMDLEEGHLPCTRIGRRSGHANAGSHVLFGCTIAVPIGLMTQFRSFASPRHGEFHGICFG
mmetsp:Transcript_6521/g.13618  ORF Transcript_6521/g.13618 Transcript_6521/m.13618 type:complete len:203 (-) Transcript_6521:1562-2170(-)